VFAALALVSSISTTAFAQERPQAGKAPGDVKVITGEVAYSNPDGEVKNQQTEALAALDTWGAQLQTIVTTSGEGKTPELDQNTVSYLSVLYLFCSVKRGPCPFILETILDSDIAASRADKEVKCALMSRFFKSYLSQSLDERGKFLFSLTEGLEIAKFNTTERPRFVECKETVSAMLADKEVLSQRFGSKGTSVETVATFRALVAEIKDQKVDIMVATGMGPH
jgi:hypothetical protein